MFLSVNIMKFEELSLLQNGDLSDHDIEKLNIVLAFYERLPTEAMKRELLQLMENQPTMLPSEFNKRLDDFAVRVKSANNYVYFSAYLANSTFSRVH